MIKNFVAFDFETASGKNPCSVGIVEFKNGVVVDEYYSLINPKIEKFNPYTIAIHGIREVDVLKEKEFFEIWNDIKHFFEDKMIIAHNSSFDLSVLNYTLERYNIPKPNYKSFCTLKISRILLELDNYKLSELANYYSIEQYNYHNALEDAMVAGHVFLKLMSEVENDSSFIDNYGSSIVHRKEPQRKTISYIMYQELNDKWVDLRMNYLELIGQLSSCIINTRFVITGVFKSISRNELKQLIKDNGGKVTGSISKKTNYIIAGDNMGPSKKEKAEKLGVPIISEIDFIELLK